MSRFIDKLKQASQLELQPLGFRTVQKNHKPRMLIIATINQPYTQNLADLSDCADACLFNVKKQADVKAIEKIAKGIPSIPCGCRIIESTKVSIEKIEQAGLDFILFSENTDAVGIIKAQEIGKIVTVDETIANDMLRVLDTMPQDAIMLDFKSDEKLSLTWQKLMTFKRFALLSAKPLLISVPLNLTADELQAIWGMGVDGLIVNITDEESINSLKDMRKTVDALTPPSKRSRNKPRAIVPVMRNEAPVAADNDDDDEDE